MLKHYCVIHSTVTIFDYCRLLSIIHFKYRNYENFKQQSNYTKNKLNKVLRVECQKTLQIILLGNLNITINHQNIEIMRTLNNNQITNKLNSTKASVWNTKRRFR
jgi:hypothetical protein